MSGTDPMHASTQAAPWAPKATERGTVYWWCRATGQSVWDEPEVVRVERVAAGVAVHAWVAAAAAAAAAPVGGKWFKVQSDSHVPCWWNSETGEEWRGSTWPLPWEVSEAEVEAEAEEVEEEAEVEEDRLAEEDEEEEPAIEEDEEDDEEEAEGTVADAAAFAPWSQQHASDGSAYWFNSVTGEATWDEPAVVQAWRAADAKTKTKAAGETEAEATSESEAECANNWSQHRDENGDEYWWNSVTGETRWDEPEAVQTRRAAAVTDAEADAATAMVDAQSTPESEACVGSVTEAEAECANNWSQHRDENGDEYWWNGVTGETRWDEPAAVQAKRAAAEAYGGYAINAAMVGAQSTPESEACVKSQAEAEVEAEADCRADWSQHLSSKGRVFWWNRSTGVKTWNEPAAVQTPPEEVPAQTRAEPPVAETTTTTGDVEDTCESECANDWSQHRDENGDEYWWNSVTGEAQWDEPEAVQTKRAAAVTDAEADAATAMVGAQSTPESEACVKSEAKTDCRADWSRHRNYKGRGSSWNRSGGEKTSSGSATVARTPEKKKAAPRLAREASKPSRVVGSVDRCDGHTEKLVPLPDEDASVASVTSHVAYVIDMCENREEGEEWF